MNEEQAIRIVITTIILSAIPTLGYLVRVSIDRWAATGHPWGCKLKTLSDYLNTGWTLSRKKHRR